MRLPLRIVTLLALGATAAGAIPYQWEPKAGESPFTIDVPDNWRTVEAVKRNGVIAQFRRRDARIEVRSFAARETLTVQQVVNQKAARLASEYSFVRLIEERDSKFRENLHLSVWEVKRRGKLYREETAVVISDQGPVVVSCLIPANMYTQYRTHCENAFYSLVLDAEKGGDAPVKADVYSALRNFSYQNLPGNLPVVAPDALMSSGAGNAAPQKPPGAVQYDDNYILPDEVHR
ncbi:MAG: hypothetical protein JNJ69_00480 [Leptospiraceae bacterium]|nr:hypothetical protein [Leptospiraceae bacterium]